MAPVSEQREELNQKLEQLVLKFSLKEVKEHVLTELQDLTWDIVVKAINQFNLSARKDDIAKLLVEFLKSFSIQDVRTVYGNLLVSDLMLHHKNKSWTVVSMRQSNTLIDDEDCEKQIVKSFQKYGKTLNIYQKQADRKTWLTLIIYHKNKNGRIRYQKPIFVAHPLNSKYLFFTPSPNTMNEETMKLIVAGFGYEDHQIMKLSSRNILSLESMLDRKKDAEKIRIETSRALKSVENEPVRSTMGFNFCRDQMRTEHAKQMFGDGSVELQVFTVNFTSGWRGVQTLPQANGQSFDFTMKLKSKNVGQTLEFMVENGALEEPYPVWAKDFVIAGKNEINVAESFN